MIKHHLHVGITVFIFFCYVATGDCQVLSVEAPTIEVQSTLTSRPNQKKNFKSDSISWQDTAYSASPIPKIDQTQDRSLESSEVPFTPSAEDSDNVLLEKQNQKKSDRSKVMDQKMKAVEKEIKHRKSSLDVEAEPIQVKTKKTVKVKTETKQQKFSSSEDSRLASVRIDDDDVDMRIGSPVAKKITPKTKYGNEKYIGSSKDYDLLDRAKPSTSLVSPGREYAAAETDFELKEHEFELGTEFYYYTYREHIFNLTIDGPMYGGFASYTHRPDPRTELFVPLLTMYRLEGRGAYGKVLYESDPSGQGLERHPDITFELRALFGKDLFIGRKNMVTPFLGIAFRYLNDDESDTRTNTGAIGYGRVSNYYYAPLGAEFKSQLGQSWRLELSAEYDWFIHGEQRSNLSDAGVGLGDLKNNQNRGYGMRGSMKLIKESNQLNFFVEPFARYWHIKDSELGISGVGSAGLVVIGLEPENKTEEYGLKLGVQF